MKSKLNVAIVRHRTVVTKRLHLFLKRYEKVEDLKPLVRLLTFMSYLYFLFLASIVWLLTIGNNQMEWHPRGPLVADIRSSWSAAKSRTSGYLAAISEFLGWRNKKTIHGHVLSTRSLAPYTQQASRLESATDCLLCRQLIWFKDKVLYLPCHKFHMFHYNCAKDFVCTKRRCPICHQVVFAKDGTRLCLEAATDTPKKQHMAKDITTVKDELAEELTEDDDDDMLSKKKKKCQRNKKNKNKNKKRRR